MGQKQLPREDTTSESSDKNSEEVGDNVEAMEIKNSAPTQHLVQSRMFDSWLTKGVWNASKDNPDDNIEVRFFGFSEAPNSPKPKADKVDPLV